MEKIKLLRNSILKILSLFLVTTIISAQNCFASRHEAEFGTDSASQVVVSEEEGTTLFYHGEIGESEEVSQTRNSESVNSGNTEINASSALPDDDKGNDAALSSNTEDDGGNSASSGDSGDGDTANTPSDDEDDTQSDAEKEDDGDSSASSSDNGDSGDSNTANPPSDDEGDTQSGAEKEDNGDGSASSSDNGDNGDSDTANPPPSGDDGGTQSGAEEKPSDDTPPKTTITISASDIDVGDVTSITLGSSQVLAVTLIPVNSTDTISFTSLTPEIASVNGLGRVKGLALGTARIQIDAGEVSQTVSIPIVPEEQEETKEPIPATAIDVSYQETMSVDTSQVLSVSLLPSDSDSKIRYSSNTPGVASVNEFGRVTALSAGTARITVSADNARTTIEITVKNDTEVQEMDFGDVPGEMTVGASQNLTVSILPAEASGQTVNYRSSNSDILEVNPFGRIVAKKPGTATITAQSGRAHCAVTITVKPEIKVEKMDFGDVPAEMTIGASQVLSVSILPTEATNQTVTYRSTDSNVLEVNPFGRVTAKAIGTATVIAQSGDVNCSATITVIVTLLDYRLQILYI